MHRYLEKIVHEVYTEFQGTPAHGMCLPDPATDQDTYTIVLDLGVVSQSGETFRFYITAYKRFMYSVPLIDCFLESKIYGYDSDVQKKLLRTYDPMHLQEPINRSSDWRNIRILSTRSQSYEIQQSLAESIDRAILKAIEAMLPTGIKFLLDLDSEGNMSYG